MTEINIDSTYGVIIIQDLKAVYVDENYARIYGYGSPQQLLSSLDSFLDLIAPDFHDVAQQNYKDTISGKMIPRGHTFTNIDRNGREFTVFSVDHVIEWQGKPALQVTIMDLTVLVEANKQLQENHKNYKNLILHSTQAIILHRNFTPLLVNPSWVKIMRAESVDFVLSQKSILDRIPLEHRETASTRNQDILADKANQTEGVVIECLCYDGEKRFFKAHDSLIDWGGEPAVQSVLEDVTEKVLLEKELLYKATHDQLTDLLNRSAIYDWLQENYQSNKTMGCLLIDIDDFKSINDSYGHHKGDQVISCFARVLKETLASKGVAARWGGEEFIAFLPELEKEQIITIAEQLKNRFGRCMFLDQEKEFYSTVSIGVSVSLDKQNRKVEALTKEADSLLYQAKKKGKNRVQYLL
jgi:diguanylate cyclase (GGDEF)-like protein/PAS domain S-box-containing protein